MVVFPKSIFESIPESDAIRKIELPGSRGLDRNELQDRE